MKAYRVKVSVKNNLLLSAIEAAGFKSIAEFERSAELRNGAVQGLVAMRDCPIGQTGAFGRVAKVVMEVLGPRLRIYGHQSSSCSNSEQTLVGARLTWI